MPGRSTRNLVYFVGEGKEGPRRGTSEDDLRRMLDALGRQVVRERPVDLEGLEQSLQDSVRKSRDEQGAESEERGDGAGSASITRMLMERGYLRDGKRWLTEKGFLAVGSKLLQDALRDLGAGEPGLHETRFRGEGGVTSDSTRRFEPGDDASYLSVPHTLLNSVRRLARGGGIDFPISIDPDDMEAFERQDDARTAIVYCIDLSSTMRYHLSGGMNRIEAAKRALWSLYALNRAFFPGDSIHVVGFASLASVVQPQDIPYLRTYDAGDGFLHYTNYQGALRLAWGILRRSGARNRRIVLITDGQPSACFVESELQRSEIVSEKPYSNFYSPDDAMLSRISEERNVRLDAPPGRLVYLCYRYKKVDSRIHRQTLREAARCRRDGIVIDSIVISDEAELLDYVRDLEGLVRGRTYHIKDSAMNHILVADYLSGTRRVLRNMQSL